MSNTNSVSGYNGSGTLRNQFPTQVIAVSTETALLVNTDTGTATAFVVAPTVGNIRGAATKLDINSNPAIIGRSRREYGLPFGESNDQFSSTSWDGVPFRVRISGVGSSTTQLAAPVNDTFTTATTGGTLADTTTYYYRVAAVNAQGGTSLASTETSLITGNSTANTNTLTVKWHAVAGATSYKVYGRSTGAELFMATVASPTLQWVDNGSVTPAGALPTSATSAVTVKLYQGVSDTLASDKAMGTTGAVAVASAGGTFNFLIQGTFQWDATSQVLSGSYTADMGYGTSSTFVAPTVSTNVVTAVPVASLSFLASATFGFASATNSITVSEFTVEKV